MPRSSTYERARTLDRGPPDANRAPPYVVGQIGPKRKILPDGSMLCEDVPIARTGTMLYRVGEVPVAPPTRPGAAPVLHVTRDRTALFAPQALGSVIGCAVTNDHPPQDVDTLNWATLSKGFVLDAWQGVGDEADLMFADIVIKDQGMIQKINGNEIREVSLGYSAGYEDLGDGQGRQHNILVNHLALVERGRCGPRCAIGDRETLNEGEYDMPRPSEGNQTPGGARPRNRLDAVRAALDVIEQEEEDGVHVHVHMGAASTHDGHTVEDPDDDARARTTDAVTDLGERVGNLEEGILEIRDLLRAQAAARTADAAKPPAGDSAALSTSFQQCVARAEVLVPGFRVPTFDSALPRARTVDAMCQMRRQVLTTLATTTAGAELIGQVADDGFDVALADCAVVATVFNSAAALKGAANNRAATGDRMSAPVQHGAQNVAHGGGMKQLSGPEINARNEKFWAEQEGRAPKA